MRKGYEKRFNPGDIVYWCRHDKSGRYEIMHGMVDEQFSDAVCIDFLAPKERRRVNGIPIDEFKSEERYHKLPKNWTYDTELFELTWDECPELKDGIDIRCPEQILAAYNAGIIVKDETLFHGKIEADITKEGYRIVKRYPMFPYHPTNTSVRPDRVYHRYEDAKVEQDAYREELLRQANLSDRDWSLEQIDKTIWQWRDLHNAPVEEVNRYHNWFAGMDRVEDIETRLSMGQIVWRYYDKKKWNFIEL